MRWCLPTQFDCINMLWLMYVSSESICRCPSLIDTMILCAVCTVTAHLIRQSWMASGARSGDLLQCALYSNLHFVQSFRLLLFFSFQIPFSVDVLSHEAYSRSQTNVSKISCHFCCAVIAFIFIYFRLNVFSGQLSIDGWKKERGRERRKHSMCADELSNFHRINIVRQTLLYFEGICIIDRAATKQLSALSIHVEVRRRENEMLFDALVDLVCESDFWMRHDSVLLQQTIIQFYWKCGCGRSKWT